MAKTKVNPTDPLDVTRLLKGVVNRAVNGRQMADYDCSVVPDYDSVSVTVTVTHLLGEPIADAPAAPKGAAPESKA